MTIDYYQKVITQIPRLLSNLDRESESASFGSFDRDHWGWKFRDYPINMLQLAIYPLAILWANPFHENPYFKNPQYFEWVLGGVRTTLERQRSNGSYDSVGPNTQDYGVTLAMVYCLTETLVVLEGSLPDKLIVAIKNSVKRGCKFALDQEEDYAFITNHQALFALALLNVHKITGEEVYFTQSKGIIQDIIQNQSSDGWYTEYEGPDPGYESLGLFYLAMYWKRTGDASLYESLVKSLEFYAYCIHPDGSVGGNYGSRHTSLYFPGGFEILAGENPLAAKIACFMRERLSRKNVVLPETTDIENLPSMTYTYLEAQIHHNPENSPADILLPCEKLDGVQEFPDSSILFVGSERYYGVFNASKGGVCIVFDKSIDNICYKDDGYLIESGNQIWSSQLIGLGRWVEATTPNVFECDTDFAQINQEILTPFKFVVLRILNLTLFRSLLLGKWIRNRIINRLITQKRRGPMRLKRRIEIDQDYINLQDRISVAETVKIEKVILPMSFTGIHMGSAKYYRSADLVVLPDISLDEFSHELINNRTAHRELRLSFPNTINE